MSTIMNDFLTVVRPVIEEDVRLGSNGTGLARADQLAYYQSVWARLPQDKRKDVLVYMDCLCQDGQSDAVVHLFSILDLAL